MPSDRRGIKQHLRPLQRGQACTLGIPLIPADEGADASEAGVEGLEAEVARREIIFFVIQRIIRDVHLAINAQQLAVGVNHGGGVVIDARRTLFKDGGDYRYA